MIDSEVGERASADMTSDAVSSPTADMTSSMMEEGEGPAEGKGEEPEAKGEESVVKEEEPEDVKDAWDVSSSEGEEEEGAGRGA